MSVTEPAPALLDEYARDGLDERSPVAPSASRPAFPVELSLVSDLALIEEDWRSFEAEADCTVFQTFAWQSAWMRNVAPHETVTPAVMVGRARDRRILFLVPLAVRRRGSCRCLTFLATDLCDYNAPLLAPDFAERVGAARFPALWRAFLAELRADPGLSPDAVILERMPAEVGAQPNPFLALAVSPSPSGAYLTRLATDWDMFYRAKRSSATRRRDRIKRKRLGNLGEVRVVVPDRAAAIGETLSTLFEQKARSFARMGVADIFARPGWAGFYRDLATAPASRHLVHVSRLEVGDIPAAASFGLLFRKRYYHILASYNDGAVSKFGPGVAHLHDLMRHAIDRGCDTFDFTIGDEPYKRDWSDTVVRLHDCRAALTWRGVLLVLPSAGCSRLKRFLKQSPLLWRAVRRLRALVGRCLARPAAAHRDATG